MCAGVSSVLQGGHPLLTAGAATHRQRVRGAITILCASSKGPICKGERTFRGERSVLRLSPEQGVPCQRGTRNIRPVLVSSGSSACRPAGHAVKRPSPAPTHQIGLEQRVLARIGNGGGLGIFVVSRLPRQLLLRGSRRNVQAAGGAATAGPGTAGTAGAAGRWPGSRGPQGRGQRLGRCCRAGQPQAGGQLHDAWLWGIEESTEKSKRHHDCTPALGWQQNLPAPHERSAAARRHVLHSFQQCHTSQSRFLMHTIESVLFIWRRRQLFPRQLLLLFIPNLC